MDKLTDFTGDIDVTTAPSFSAQNCAPNSSSSSAFFDKLFITAPSWHSINQELRWIFLLHAYGFASLFSVLAFYTFFSFLNLRSLISSRPFMSTINIFLCLLGASRAACLFIDPYNLKETMPKIIGSIIWDIGLPCITSAFCLIQLAFLQLTQLKFGPEKIQKKSCLSLIITGHFVFVIASDVALTSHNCYMAKYVIQIVFLVWSFLLYVTFLHAGYKMMNLLRTMPSIMLTRDNTDPHRKGIMQLAMLAPHSNLACSITAALVPTLLGPSNVKDPQYETNERFIGADIVEEYKNDVKGCSKACKQKGEKQQKDASGIEGVGKAWMEGTSTVPEVYVRPPTPTPTPTPSAVNLPIITVSSPSRTSRRNSGTSQNSRRNSECSIVRFVSEEDASPTSDFNCGRIPSGRTVRSRSPDRTSRRHSETVTLSASSRELRRYSEAFSHEKNRSSQFATKLRRNSDFGNRTPRRMLPAEDHRLTKLLDSSTAALRRNSDVGGTFAPPKCESRRNSDISSSKRSCDFVQTKALIVNRRSSDISIRTLDKSPTHYHGSSVVPTHKIEIQEKSESDSDHADCSEKAALMNERFKIKDVKPEDVKSTKKNLSWKSDKHDEADDVTAQTNLLAESDTSASNARVTMGNDFTLRSILNHIAYANRTKSDIPPLHIPEATTAAVRRSQIRRVLRVTYATAIFGIVLCLAEDARIFGPYGLLAESVPYGTRPLLTQFPKAWPWLLYQTLCRLLELIMGCALASITKQPSVSRHRCMSGYPSYSAHVKRGNNLYI